MVTSCVWTSEPTEHEFHTAGCHTVPANMPPHGCKLSFCTSNCEIVSLQLVDENFELWVLKQLKVLKYAAGLAGCSRAEHPHVIIRQVHMFLVILFIRLCVYVSNKRTAHTCRGDVSASEAAGAIDGKLKQLGITRELTPSLCVVIARLQVREYLACLLRLCLALTNSTYSFR